MLRILIAVLCMIFTPEICGTSLQQFLGHYEYNCYYNGEKLVLNFSKISCHDLTVTEKGDDCFDGYLYSWDGKA